MPEPMAPAMLRRRTAQQVGVRHDERGEPAVRREVLDAGRPAVVDRPQPTARGEATDRARIRPSSMNGMRMNQSVAPTSFITSISRRLANMAVRIVFQISRIAANSRATDRITVYRPDEALEPRDHVELLVGEDDPRHVRQVAEAVAQLAQRVDVRRIGRHDLVLGRDVRRRQQVQRRRITGEQALRLGDRALRVAVLEVLDLLGQRPQRGLDLGALRIRRPAG